MELLLDGPDFVYDPRAGRYRFKDSGRFVNGNQFRFLTQKFIKTNEQKIQGLLRDRFDNLITHEDWRKQTLGLLKTNSLQTFILHRGGAGRVTTDDLKRLTDHSRKQFGFFRNLSALINFGQTDLESAAKRLTRYIENSAVVETIAHQQNSGASWGYRVLGAAEHCNDCINHAAAGLRPLDQLVAPGNQCICGSRCHCSTFLFGSFEDAVKSMRSGQRTGSLQIQLGKLPKSR